MKDAFLGIASFDLGGQPAAEIQLLPAGIFKATDGRPRNAPHWKLDSFNATAVLSAAVQQRNKFLIDYEHQSLYTELNGKPNPAAGWFAGSDMQFRPEDGLWAMNVEWTPAAAKAIADKEYRYLSPVFIYDKQGNVTKLLQVALTNTPAIDGMADVVNRAAARYGVAAAARQVQLNQRGVNHAKTLISDGKVDKTSAWSISAQDENAMLGVNSDWRSYGAWHLGIDQAAADNTKQHFRYPFGKGGRVYRSALEAIRQRAGQQGDESIFQAAGRLIDAIDNKATARRDFTMNEKLRKLLDLADDADETAIEEAVVALKAKADENTTKIGELEQSLAAAKTKNPDPEKFVSVEVVDKLTEEVAALKQQNNDRDVNDLVETALNENKLHPAQEEWARELGKNNIAALRAYLEKAPRLAPGKGNQTGGSPPAGPGEEGELTEDDLAVCKHMGIDPEEYKKTAA